MDGDKTKDSAMFETHGDNKFVGREDETKELAMAMIDGANNNVGEVDEKGV